MSDKSDLINDFVNVHYNLQHGCYFSSLLNVQDDLFAFSDIVSCFIWNHAFFRTQYFKIDEIELAISNTIRFFMSRNRLPSIYTYSEIEEELLRFILDKGFIRKDIESWLIFEGASDEFSKLDSIEIAIIQDIYQLNRFTFILNMCFSPDYGAAVLREFTHFFPTKQVYHFLGSLNKSPCFIGSLYVSHPYGVIHNMGTTPDSRRLGLASHMLNFILAFAKKKNIDHIFLQCDGDTETEKFYHRRGFEPFVKRYGYVLETTKTSVFSI